MIRQNFNADWTVEKGDGNSRMNSFLAVSYTHLDVYKRQLPFHGADAQAADDDVDVDVPGTIVTVRVGADDGDVYKRQGLSCVWA